MGRVEQEGIGVVIGKDYPGPIVDHAQAREETLARYAVVKNRMPGRACWIRLGAYGQLVTYETRSRPASLALYIATSASLSTSSSVCS